MKDWPDFDALWNYDDPAGTEAAFRDVLAQAGADAPGAWRAELNTQIARSLGLQRRFDEADRHLDGVRTEAEKDPRVTARWLLERGRIRNSSGRKKEAAPLFEEAGRKAEEVGADFFAVDALHMLAIAAPLEEQLEWHRRAIDRAASSNEERARNWRASLLNNLGWTLHDSGHYEEALKTFEEALVARIEQGKPGPILVARWCVARCMRSLNRFEEALTMQSTLHLEHEAAGTPDGFVDEEWGECLLALGRAEEARPHFQRAFDALSQDAWLRVGEPARIARLQALAEGSETGCAH